MKHHLSYQPPSTAETAPNPAHLPISRDRIVAASGARLFGASGRTYVDFANAILAYQHPVITRAAVAALDQLPLSSRMLFSAPLAQLTSRLSGMLWNGATVAYPCNSPSEAMEGALKLALGVHRGRRKVFVTVDDSLHGNTLGALSASSAGDPTWRLERPLFGVRRITADSGSLSAIDSSVAAVVLEPVQRARGLAPLPPGFFRRVRKACHDTGAMLIVNETLTGLGRLGSWFGWQASAEGDLSSAPDALVLGDILGGNLLPYGAYLAREDLNSRVYKRANPALHGGTTAGHPLGCQIALAVLDLLARENIAQRARDAEAILHAELGRLASLFPEAVVDTVAVGFIGALRFRDPLQASALLSSCEVEGLWLRLCGTPRKAPWIAIMPPLLVTDFEWDHGLARLRLALTRALRQPTSP